jgi:putative ATP-binding cassette transporter
MKVISFLVRNYPGRTALAVLASVIAGASNAGLLTVLNNALRSDGSAKAGMFWGFAGLCFLVALSRLATELLLTNIGQGTLFDLRMKICRHILATPLKRLEELGEHRLLAILIDDVSTVSATPAILSVCCINIAIVIGGVCYMAWLSPPVLLLVCGLIVVGAVTYHLPVRKAVRYFALTREGADELFSHFRALVMGAKELKLNRRRREVFTSETLHNTATSLRRNYFAGTAIYAAATSWGQILVFIIIALTVFTAPTLYRLDAPVLMGFTLTLLFLMAPLQVILNTMPNLARIGVALKKIEALAPLLERAANEVEPATAPDAKLVLEHLQFTEVAHSYRREGESESFTLGPLNLELSAGELVFVVGGNGSGKTTLAKLLTGLYVPEVGEVRLNGQLVTDENRSCYREHFSTVFSDFYLFQNLVGLEDVRLDEEARRYLTSFHLDHKVEIKDGLLSTVNLSQGQRKRLALLMAFLEDRPCYLFDEWAADQDPLFKNIFYLRLLPDLKSRGKTIVVISHDDRYYHIADRLIKLEAGKIEIDSGAHPLELLRPGL